MEEERSNVIFGSQVSLQARKGIFDYVYLSIRAETISAKDHGRGLQRFLLVLILLSLILMVACLLVFAQLWRSSQTSGQRPTPTPTVTITPHPTPTPVIIPTPNASLAQRIDTYIDHMMQMQQIRRLLMLAVCTNGYTIHS